MTALGTMPMAWQRMPGQTWPGAAASFLGMWVVMMAAMMLPSLVPALRRYRLAVGACGKPQLGVLTALVAAGYFVVWAAFGLAVFPLGAGLTSLAMRLPALARAVPMMVGVTVACAAVLQFSEWKSRHLDCWRASARNGLTVPADASSAWRHGVRLGLNCCRCSAGLTAILCVMGVMNLRAMAVVGVAITAERLAPNGARTALIVGAIALGVGSILIVRAF